MNQVYFHFLPSITDSSRCGKRVNIYILVTGPLFHYNCQPLNCHFKLLIQSLQISERHSKTSNIKKVYLINGTRNKTRNILPSPKCMWERMAERWCCLDGWKCYFTWTKIERVLIAINFHHIAWLSKVTYNNSHYC